MTQASPGPLRTRRFHALTLAVLVVGLVLTAGFTIGAARSIEGGQSRTLTDDLRQVTSALEASVPSIQQPLVAGARIASSDGVGPFRVYEETEVGGGAPFRSVSLWRRELGSFELVAVVGERPEALHGNGAVLSRLRGLKPGERLGVLGLVVGPARALAFAELLPGTRLLVYAEDPLPRGSSAQFAASSPFAGLHFELFLGPDRSPSRLIETDLARGIDGPSRTATVAYGSSSATIVVVLTTYPPGLLPPQVPRAIAYGGLLLTALAAVTAERLVRRREKAELVAVDTGQRYDEQRGISETLQHSLLPPEEVSFPGMAITGAYVAGVRPLGVGGDWYDAIPIDDEHLFVSVGDVAGRGHRAAGVMSSLRHAIRAYAVQGDQPGEVLRKLNDLVDIDRDDSFATVLGAFVDVPARTLEIVSAGHLPPLLVDGEGARYLSMHVAVPVGLVRDWDAPIATRVTLSPGSMLVFFTDGLVERRGSVVDDGLERLRRHVADSIGLRSTELVSGILRDLVPEEGGDDLAILVLRWTGATDDGSPRDTNLPLHGPFTRGTSVWRTFACEATSVERARAFVAGCLSEAAQGVREVATLLTSELATNAILHAQSEFDVGVEVAGMRVRVEVADRGHGLVPTTPKADRLNGGNGLWILTQLSESWGVEQRVDGANVVWFELPDERERGVP
jgi:serine phosphatase RsbU (regulator of sigma subunit)/anti-sigma regulatory factor (Ser/Thr protein kinase)